MDSTVETNSVGATSTHVPPPADHKLAVRWGKHGNLFARGWVGVPDFFLGGYSNLKPYALTAAEAMFVLQLMAFKWTEQAPFPSYARLAKRMGVTAKQVQRIARSLESKGYLERIGRIGATNKFNLQPLFDALSAAQVADAAPKIN